MNLYKSVSDSIKAALGCVPELSGVDLAAVSIEAPKDRAFGDYATNAAMVLTKQLGQPPRQIAETILPYIAALDFVADISIAGPGFINIKLKDEFILNSANQKSQIINRKSEIIDLDYGSYNIAKAMHIGHLRGSIVGDTLYRIARFLGHRPISYNHIGDWGKPMALVIAWIMKKFPQDWNKPDFKIDETEFNDYYPAASAHAKENPEFLKQVLAIKKKFQDGHPEYFALYEKMMKISMSEMESVVKRLNIIPFDNTLGERNAAKYLDAVEKILRDKNLLTTDDGATIINLKTDLDTAPMPPFMFYDSRGADTYDSTDLAATYYKKNTDNPDKIIYVSDFRQNLHFEQLFRVSEMIGLFPRSALESVGFGSINGKDGKPLKTRSGANATLTGVIDTVIEAVCARVKESGKNLPDDTIAMIALAALKFNDLMHDVKSDYIFDPDAVTQFEGRTGPYILYTAVRLNSVLKRAQSTEHRAKITKLSIEERNLLLGIMDFERTVQNAFDKRSPDILTNYAYDLCQMANTFYHNCPILREDVDGDTRAHRLQIAAKARDTLVMAIELMGLRVPSEM
ncbi:MAG: arginine--tRNA ligase [Alphaproteobacteria bacterium]|nr:arginine--tRNA ligase [Alphaproteobacteria bacterium]